MISIILPIRNEIQFIEKTIESILSQGSNEDIEIIIADGMSNDGTRDKLSKMQKGNPNIRVIDNPEQIVSTGFNRALTQANGNIIIRVDGHSEIHPSFMETCISILKEKKVACVGGPTEHIATGYIGESINLAQSSYFGVGGVQFRRKVDAGQWVDTLAFGAYKRSVFEKIGGYDEELVRNQDDEFNFRLIQNGGKIWLDPSIKSKYFPRNSYLALFKQYFQYGFYKIRVMQKRRGFASWRHLVPGLFVLSLCLSSYLYLSNENPILLKLIGVPYVLLGVLFTGKECFNSPKSYVSIFLLPLTFFILHFSYGLGFILGSIYYWNKWTDRDVKDSHFDKESFLNNV